MGQVQSESKVLVAAATIGKVIDYGVADPFNMGAAMAPAAADTLQKHLEERQVPADYYDLILTGDLGKVGSEIFQRLLSQRGIKYNSEKLEDGGKLIYPDNGKFFAGGSGCGCMATVAYGYIMKLLLSGKLRKALCIATGALLSPLTVQQQESIPCVAHAVALEVREE